MDTPAGIDAATWTPRARSVWAKTNVDDQTWFPLVQHLLDAAVVAGELFDELPETIMRAATDDFRSDEAEARCFIENKGEIPINTSILETQP
ncbi:HD domain-containing protein [Propionibacterium australiense]|uniref:HD domain-containing protein n=1 Tax=Propionibacterium australiense TaxID=119981 RepID=UPI0011C4390A|nr:HD domain-containing protein [Propionibacterium australiense]